MLLGVIDADCKVIWASVGSEGSASDAGIFGECSLRTTLDDNSTGFLPAESPLKDDWDVPYFMLGDDAFPHANLADETLLHERQDARTKSVQLQAVRVRRVMEDAFGILALRWRC